MEWINIMKVANNELYAIKLVDTLSIDNPLFQPAAMLLTAMMQLVQAAKAPSSIAG